MLFTEEQSDVILNHPKNLVNQVVKNNSHLEIKKLVHNTGNPHTMTEAGRVLIGTMARAGFGTGQEIADQFGIDRNTVVNYKAGRTTRVSSNTFVPHPELEQQILGKLTVVEDRAITVLMDALGVITPDKLSKVNPKDASSIAANASKIVANCAPKTINDNKIQVVMYAPKQKELDDFKVVEI